MLMSPVKRALRNSVILAFVVTGIVTYQGATTLDSLLTGLFTFMVTFPALWLSFTYTQKIAEKYRNQNSDSDSNQP